MKDVDTFYNKIEAPRILLVNGKLMQTSVDKSESAEKESEYYRLVGEAYNQKKLDRAEVKD